MNTPSLTSDKVPSSSPTNDSIQTFVARSAAIPNELRHVLAEGGKPVQLPEDVQRQRFVVTGVGCSASPARFLVHLLREHLQVRASFVPISSFYQSPPPSNADTLIVFSQGLSPNAAIALEHVNSYKTVVLFTSVVPNASAEENSPECQLAKLKSRGVVVWQTRPIQETGLLVRILGTSVARLAAALFTGSLANAMGREDWPKPPADLPERVNAALGKSFNHESNLFSRPLILVTCGGYDSLCQGLAWSILETLLVPLPPVLDAFSLAHGAFQQIYDSPCDILALGQSSTELSIFKKIEQMLVSERHKLLYLPSTLPSPYSIFEHEGMIASLMAHSLRRRPRNLFEWPGKGLDAPLYELKAPPGSDGQPVEMTCVGSK